MHIDKNSRISRVTGNAEQMIDGELVIMSLESNAYYSLADSSLDIWRKLDTEKSIEDLCVELIKEYNVELEDCINDVVELVQDLLRKKLVEINN